MSFWSPRNKATIASVLFGLGSWIAICSVNVEQPVLVTKLPEKWALSSHINLFIQAGNLGPAIYLFAKRWNWIELTDSIHVQLTIGFISCLGLIFSWDKTFYLFGAERSAVLFGCMFGLSLVDCVSSVTFLPFMGRFKSYHLTPYLIGEGLSGFIPVVVAMFQGDVLSIVHCEPSEDSINSPTEAANTMVEEVDDTSLNFPPSVFFVSMLVTLIICWGGFLYLQLSSAISSQRVDTKNVIYDPSMPSDGYIYMTRSRYYLLQGLIGFACVLTFGIFPGTQTYSTLPYSISTFKYTVILSNLAFPAGCALALFKEVKSIPMILVLTALATAASGYIMAVSMMSPSPPLLNHNSGSVLIVTCWFLFTLLFSYVKTLVTIMLSKFKGEDALFIVGLSTQIGSIFGAIIMFLMVSYFKLFHDKCD